MGHVSILQTITEVLDILHMVLLTVEHPATEVWSNVQPRIGTGYRGAEQLLNNVIGLSDIELLALETP
jgi:hypothetical protein